MRKLFIFLGSTFLFQFAFGQVSPQSGSATFSLPLFQWQDDKSKLASSLALNYSSGNGLKVNEVASNIGQGWRLAGLGVITRIQVGQPDDQPAYTSTTDPLKKYPAGMLYNNADISKGCPDALTRYPIYGHRNQLYAQHNSVATDRELDYFTYEFNGNSGMFILPRDNNNEGIFINDSKMKIWFVKNENNPAAGIRTTITAFYIQDQNGIIYKYANYETTKILKYAYMDARTGRQISQPNLEAGNVYHEGSFDDNSIANPNVINSWYLSEIKDPLTNRVITFKYANASIAANAGISLAHYDGKDYSVVSHSTSKTVTPEIDSIQFPDGHLVLFGYRNTRIDLPGAHVMKYIDVKYGGRYISKFDLKTSYFIRNRLGNPVSHFQIESARLCLLSVRRTGVDLMDTENPYSFDYYMGSSSSDDFVPPPFFYARDIWGYFNGQNSKAFTSPYSAINLTKDISELSNDEIKGLCFLKSGSSPDLLNAKPGYAKNGLLRQIVYPTGGVLRYEYEQNQFNWGSGLKDAAGVRVSRTLLSDGEFSNTCSNPLVTNYAYKEANGSPSLWGLETPVNKTEVRQFYSPERRYFKALGLKCDYRYKYPGILSRDQAVSLTSMQQALATLSTIMDVVSAVSTAVDVITVCFASTPLAIVAVVIDAISTIVGILITCTGSPDTLNETINVYSNSDINLMNPLPSQFRRVEVTESSGTNGKTIMEFSSPIDPDGRALWVPEDQNTMLSMRQRYGFWAYGLPKKTTVLDASGNKVREVENMYDYPLRMYGGVKYENTRYLSCKCKVEKSSSQRDVDWNDPLKYDDPAKFVNQTRTIPELKAQFYNVYAGRAELIDTYERVYKPGSSSFAETRTSYSYNANNYLVNSIYTTSSNGDEQSKQIAYSSDFGTGILQTLKTNNALNIPVSTSAYIKKSGETSRKLLSEAVTEFSTIPNGDIRPTKTLEQRFTSPQATFSLYQGPGNPSNPTYIETQTFIYNNASDLAGMKDEGGRTIYNIYDYSGKYVIASIINSNPLTDKSAYTSFETTVFGGWILNGSATYNTNSSVTGERSFTLSAGVTLSTSITTSRPHIVSFWATSALTVSGATLLKSSPAINGFTYYEYSVPAGSGTVTVQGNANIDELRSYPSTARMRTVSYDPLVGKTSECDENNRITYYEYDELGRLRFIKDDLKNIVKMYEYNTAMYKPNGCTSSYGNKAISEVYQRNNCGSGYIGGKVPYSIPAGKYTSSISQEVADMMAEAELESFGQNTANTSGACTAVFGNDLQSKPFTKDNCGPGMVGSSVTYSVPANTYFAATKNEANQLALAEIDANGYTYAIQNGTCSVSTTPVWESDGEEPQFACQKNASNNNTGNQLVLLRDVNPNSSTYNDTTWQNIGTNTTACPIPPPPSCDPAVCNKPFQKCVNNQCEFGHYEMLYMTNTNNVCTIYYGYRFSDGSYKVTSSEQTPGQCP